jgi:hypothetical protein
MRLEYCAIVAGHDPTQSFADLENLNLASTVRIGIFWPVLRDLT